MTDTPFDFILRVRGFLRRRVVHPLEAAAALGGYGLFRFLPLDVASAVGGWIGRSIGPRLRVTEVARRNLGRAFPDWAPRQVEATIRAMWDNIGRTVGEYPHLAVIARDRVTIEGVGTIDLLRDDGLPGIFFSGHFGNWELSYYCAQRRGVPLHLIYRSANNPLVETLYIKGRRAGAASLIPKGGRGARQALMLLKKGAHLGMLVDQKMNDGIPVPFLGRDAMTAPALALFALRARCPVVPARVIRLKGAHFRVVVEPPMAVPDSGDRHADSLALMTEVNAIMGRWVREHPEQWLWVHRRWP